MQVCYLWIGIGTEAGYGWSFGELTTLVQTLLPFQEGAMELELY